MSTDSLIEKLEATKRIYNPDAPPDHAFDAHNNAIDHCISIIRQHTSAPDVVELRAMFGLGFKRGSLWAGSDVEKEPQCDEIIEWQLGVCKEAAIAAMGCVKESPETLHVTETCKDFSSEIPDTNIKQIADSIWRKMQPGESGVSREMIADEIRGALKPVLKKDEYPNPSAHEVVGELATEKASAASLVGDKNAAMNGAQSSEQPVQKPKKCVPGPCDFQPGIPLMCCTKCEEFY